MCDKAVAAALMDSHPWDTATCHYAMPVTLSTDGAWVKPYAMLFGSPVSLLVRSPWTRASGLRRHASCTPVDYPGTIDIPGLRFEHRRKSMSTQRFTPEFKAEAVRQVIERGYSVAEIAARLSVSTHSLYKWVKAVPPTSRRNRPANCWKPRAKSCGCGPRCVALKKSGTS